MTPSSLTCFACWSTSSSLKFQAGKYDDITKLHFIIDYVYRNPIPQAVLHFYSLIDLVISIQQLLLHTGPAQHALQGRPST
jgi:hypothetical protein